MFKLRFPSAPISCSDEAGVKVTTVRYNGMIHDFGLLNGLAEGPAVRSLFEHAAAELKKYLQREGDKSIAGD